LKPRLCQELARSTTHRTERALPGRRITAGKVLLGRVSEGGRTHRPTHPHQLVRAGSRDATRPLSLCSATVTNYRFSCQTRSVASTQKLAQPVTPSLPWNHREPPWAAPFPQVKPNRRRRSYRFFPANLCALKLSAATHARSSPGGRRCLAGSGLPLRNHGTPWHTRLGDRRLSGCGWFDRSELSLLGRYLDV
jgi:hypothetical protein